jgi:hypothetical protein
MNGSGMVDRARIGWFERVRRNQVAFARWINRVSQYKDLTTVIQNVAAVVAIIVAGSWTYSLTKQFRDTVPRMEIRHAVSSWRLRDNSILVRVDSTLINNGKVLIRGLKGNLIVLRLLPELDEQTSEYANGSLFFTCTDAKGQKIPGCIPEQGLNLPKKSIIRFSIEDPSRTLEPSEVEAYWRYVHLDGAAKVLELQTFIEVPGTSGKRGWTVDTTHNITPN